ncbi:MAG: hypothetical protein GXO42_02680 [bacterium]|nr:hypothetical protein [bacterium]
MRGITYAAIIGATVLFIIIISTLLWERLYLDWRHYMQEQEQLFLLYPNLSLAGAASMLQVCRNTSNLTVNLTMFARRQVFLYPSLQKLIKARCRQLNFSSCNTYYINNYSYILVARKMQLNYSNRKLGIIIFEFIGTRKAVFPLGSYPLLPSILFVKHVFVVNSSFSVLLKAKNASLVLLKNKLLRQLEKEYYASLNGSSKYFKLELPARLCQELRQIEHIYSSGASFSGGKVVLVKIETSIPLLRVYLLVPRSCQLFLARLRRILVKFSYFLNNNTSPLLFFPQKAKVFVEELNLTGNLTCSAAGLVLYRPPWLNASIAQKICEQAARVFSRQLKSAGEKKFVGSISGYSPSCPSKLPFLKCLGACAEYVLSVLKAALQRFVSALFSIFGAGSALQQYSLCLQNCIVSEKACLCKACCRGSNPASCGTQVKECIAACKQELLEKAVRVQVKEIVVRLRYGLLLKAVDTGLVYYEPHAPATWHLLQFYIYNIYDI